MGHHYTRTGRRTPPAPSLGDPNTDRILALIARSGDVKATSDFPATLMDVARAFPYRTLLGQFAGLDLSSDAFPPVRGAVAIRPGHPFPAAELAETISEVRRTIALGGSFLILATTAQERDDLKGRLTAAIAAWDSDASSAEGRA